MMATGNISSRAFSILIIIIFLLIGIFPAQTVNAGSSNAIVLPTSLSADDWKQINALLPITSPPDTQQAYLKASNTGDNDLFGQTVSLSGDTLVVGAWSEDSNATGVNGDSTNDLAIDSGAVYVFIRSGGIWSQQAYLKASNAEAGDHFGTSVSISGDTLVIGAEFEDNSATGVNNSGTDTAVDSGAAYVFTRNGSTWSQQAYLKASNTLNNDRFGSAVSISGDTLIVGARYEDATAIDSGAVYVFTRTGTTWSQQAYLKASNSGPYDKFGLALSISNDTLAVGAYEDSNATGINGNQADDSATDSGAVYIFTRSAGTWSQSAYVKASNTNTGDRFGVSVSISNDTLVVGALLESSNATGINGNEADNSAPSSGAAYVFTRSAGTWSQQSYIKASNAEAGDAFGVGVSISGEILVVGAYGESSSNGDQADNAAPASGAAYVFIRNGTTWSQQAYLKASNEGANDFFGYSVSISGNTFAAGAQQESSNAIGINGNGTDNSISHAGAAYAFSVIPPSVTSSARMDTNPTAANSVNFRITFSEAVTGMDAGDLSLATTIASGAAVSGFSGTGSTYTVTVTTGTGNGTIRLNVVNNGTIMDLMLNPMETSFTGGETYTIIRSATFADVPLTYWANGYIERLYNASITSGCGTGIYCPDDTVTRAQMAVFLLKGMHGSGFTPPAINGNTGFADVAASHWAATWIKQLAAEGITSGCGNGNYCPEATVTRAQMAIFLLKAKHGSSYVPSNATGIFSDVPVGYWADKWIEQLAAEGITSGCGNGNYCPDNPVTRAQMAIFLVKNFSLP